METCLAPCRACHVNRHAHEERMRRQGYPRGWVLRYD